MKPKIFAKPLFMLYLLFLSDFKFFFFHRVQSAQQFQALQAQYSATNPSHQFHHPEEPPGAEHMANPEATMGQQEAANLSKRTVNPLICTICFQLNDNIMMFC